MSAADRLAIDVVGFLSCPGVYPDRPSEVQIVETHISQVFLTKRFAYKLKKPVRFDFLDFSDLELRKTACDSEVQLNRRLAPSVYLGVVPVCRDEKGVLSLGGKGEPIEWLVQMRRLDDSHSLAAIAETGNPSSDQVASLASRLADFFVLQAPAVVKSEDYVASLVDHIESNRHELLRTEPERAARVTFAHSAQMRFVNLFRQLIRDRVCDGRIVDGHGDLRPEHIYFEKEPVIIDCIEFNEEYRLNDIVDEIAFLAMECDRLRCEGVGEEILQAYKNASGDRPDPLLVAFYKCYRASVRAKVCSLRDEQLLASQNTHKRDTQDSYLELADWYSRILGPKIVITVGGLMGTGKSTVATFLSEKLCASVLRTDVIRNDLYRRDDGNAYGKGKYSAEARQRVYEEMLRQVPSTLQANPTLVLDGTFSKNSLISEARSVAEEKYAKSIHVECHCPKEISLQRISDRSLCGDTASEARPDLYDEQAAEYESNPTNDELIRIDTNLPLGEQVAAVLDQVRTLFPKPTSDTSLSGV